MKLKALYLVALCVLSFVPLSATEICPSPGDQVGAGNAYEFIANGYLEVNASCWITNASRVIAPDCFSINKPWFQFDYREAAEQEHLVLTQNQHWQLRYDLTMIDPNNDGWWNRLRARVVNLSTGQTLASHTYWGDDPDVSCLTRTLNFSGDFEGDTLQVIFDGGAAYPNTVIRVSSISLLASRY